MYLTWLIMSNFFLLKFFWEINFQQWPAVQGWKPHQRQYWSARNISHPLTLGSVSSPWSFVSWGCGEGNIMKDMEDEEGRVYWSSSTETRGLKVSGASQTLFVLHDKMRQCAGYLSMFFELAILFLSLFHISAIHHAQFHCIHFIFPNCWRPLAQLAWTQSEWKVGLANKQLAMLWQ